MNKFDRKKHNQEILERFKKGITPIAPDTHTARHPVRPIIKKDKEAIAKLYGPKTKPLGE